MKGMSGERSVPPWLLWTVRREGGGWAAPQGPSLALTSLLALVASRESGKRNRTVSKNGTGPQRTVYAALREAEIGIHQVAQ